MVILYSRWVTLLAGFCALTFCIIGVLGNLFTILAILKCAKLRKHATSSFILSLCVSDLVFCAFNMPLTATRYFLEEWTFGVALCKLFPVFFYGNVAVSVINMMAITINRYVMVNCTEKYSKIYTGASVITQIILSWVIAFLIMLPPLIGVWGELGLDEKTFSCTILSKNGKSPKKVIFVVGFLVPCAIIILSYSCIYMKVYQSKRKLQAFNVVKRNKEDNRLTALMLMIFLYFLACFLPLMLVNVLDDLVHPNLHVLASTLAWSSSVINPIVYALTNAQYRAAYVQILTSLTAKISPMSRISTV